MARDAGAALTDEQVADFARDGYIVLPALFAHAELAALREAADRIFELAIRSTAALARRHPRMDVTLHDDATVTLRKIQPVNDLSPVVAAVSTDARLVAPMAQLMGDEPVLMEEKLNYKQWADTSGLDLSVLRNGSRFLASTDTGIEGFHLHHDWGYYRQQGYPENTLSSAVAIDDCAGRGPIRVIPGSHLTDAPLIDPDPASGSGLVADGFFEAVDLTPIDAPAGSVMVFHAKLVHDSEPNPTRLPRRMMIYSHYPKSHDPAADPDRRNGPARKYAQDFERRYTDMVSSGVPVPTFAL